MRFNQTPNTLLPKAKTDNIVVQNLHDEVLIYNLNTNQAFSLNETSAKVFNHCDGKSTFDELKRKYQFTDDLIYLALDELGAHDLLKDYQGDYFKNTSRRELIKKVGLASLIALPVIVAITAPQASDAASGTCARDTCFATADCLSPCTACSATGSCSVGGAVCSGSGTRCSVTGTCNQPRGTFTGTCSAGGSRCTGNGTSCTSLGTCNVTAGTCS